MVVRADDDAVAAFDHRGLEIRADARVAGRRAGSIVGKSALGGLSVQLRIHARGDVLSGLAAG